MRCRGHHAPSLIGFCLLPLVVLVGGALWPSSAQAGSEEPPCKPPAKLLPPPVTGFVVTVELPSVSGFVLAVELPSALESVVPAELLPPYESVVPAALLPPTASTVSAGQLPAPTPKATPAPPRSGHSVWLWVLLAVALVNGLTLGMGLLALHARRRGCPWRALPAQLIRQGKNWLSPLRHHPLVQQLLATTTPPATTVPPRPQPSPEPPEQPEPKPNPAPKPRPEAPPGKHFPTRYLHKLTAEEADALMPEAARCGILPPRHELCTLIQAGDAATPAQLHRRCAADFLKAHGMPTGQPEPRSWLHQAEPGEHFWFLGDIHCDWRALTRALSYVLLQCERDPARARHTLIFCGDLIDRGAESLNTLSTLFRLLLTPHERLRVHFIRGNHDAALRLNPSPAADIPPFSSLVIPSETSTELNQLWQKEPELALLVGQALIRLAEISPCMGEITGLDPQHPERTLLITHGGLPHTDLQQQFARADAANPQPPSREQLRARSFLETLPQELRAAAARDFTWVRLVPGALFKQPSQVSSEREMGIEDVRDFCQQHQERTGRVLSYIIRGHDHESPGYRLYSYDRDFLPPDAQADELITECGVLTLSTMGPIRRRPYNERRIALAHTCSCNNPAVELTLLEARL